jgi:hypothetical protein
MGDAGSKVAPAPGYAGDTPAGAFISKGPAQVGEALEHVANVATAQLGEESRELIAEAKHEARVAAAEAKADAKEQRRIAAVRATTDYGNDVADLHQSLVVDLQTGKLKPDKLQETFDAQAGKLRERHSKEIAPELSGAVQAQLDNTFRDTRRRLAVDLENQRRTQQVADFGAVREGLERRAQRDLPGAIAAYEVTAREVLKSAGFDDAKIAGDVQAFKEKTTFNHVSTLTDRARENPRALNQLRATLADPKQFEVLDPDRRRILSHTVDGRLEVLKNRAERDADKRERAVEREMNAVSRLSLQGVNPTPERLAALSGAVRGTPFAAEFKGYLDGLADQRAFGSLPPARMAAAIESDMATVAKNGGNEADRMRIARRTQQYELTVRQLTQDPLAYNARTTGAEVPAIDFARPETLPANLRARADTLVAMNRTHGAALGLFRPDEALKARQMLKGLDHERRAGFLNTLRASVGTSSGVYNATLAQIAPDSPVTALAGTYLGKADVYRPKFFGADLEIKANDVAVRMLRGESLINPPASRGEDGKPRGYKFAPQGEAAFQTYFEGFAGNAWAGAFPIKETYRQAVLAVYADMDNQETGGKGEVTEARVRKAFELVTGGGVTRFGRSDVIPPFGMTPETMRSAVYTEFNKLREAGNTKLPATFIQNAGLRQIDEGRYIVTSGGRPVPDELHAGEPLAIDISGKVPRGTGPAPTNRQPKAPR